MEVLGLNGATYGDGSTAIEVLTAILLIQPRINQGSCRGGGRSCPLFLQVSPTSFVQWSSFVSVEWLGGSRSLWSSFGFLWVNCKQSLTWIKANSGMIPLLSTTPSKVVVIHPEFLWFYTILCHILSHLDWKLCSIGGSREFPWLAGLPCWAHRLQAALLRCRGCVAFPAQQDLPGTPLGPTTGSCIDCISNKATKMGTIICGLP